MADALLHAHPPRRQAPAAARAREHLEQAVGETALTPRARLRMPERDLLICDGAGIVHYALRGARAALHWTQRALAFPDRDLLSEISVEEWSGAALHLLRTSSAVQGGRVTVGVVAAEARACEERDCLAGAEDAVHAMSEAAAAVHLSRSGCKSRPARKLLEDVERSRAASHVPLHRLQRALLSQFLAGRLACEICVDSAHFRSAVKGNGAATNEFYRRLGLIGFRAGDAERRLRFARVARAEVAERLCGALGLAPWEVGL